jgi:pyruvate ferredoxin oxidoreductase alpha subunit
MAKKTVALTGNIACAHAWRQIDPDVVPAYPITPQTTVVEEFSSFVANGQVHTEYVTVESEHSAMSAAIGASAAGARVITATSSQGLALMWEMLYIASAMRLPIVMHNANRALSGPINIHCDHSDSMGARDSGWVQLHSESAQEAYDNTLMAVRIAEHPDVKLPVMVCLDGFIITHSIDKLDLEDDAEVKAFVGDYVPENALLDVANPVTHGSFDPLHGYYFEWKRQQDEAMAQAARVIGEVSKEFGKKFGRTYGHIAPYLMDDAELAIVVLGSTAGNVKAVVDDLRMRGVKAGMVKVRSFRPFPSEEIADALAGAKAVAVLDRSDTPGAAGGPVWLEVRSALYDRGTRLPVIDYLYGLGGREVNLELIETVYNDLADLVSGAKELAGTQYLGLRK